MNTIYAEYLKNIDTSALPVGRRPVIGITSNYGSKGSELAVAYYRSVVAAGGTPVILPPVHDSEVLRSMLESVDGLLLSGGSDLNPLLIGEEPIPELGGINTERDLFELALVRLAYRRHLPILGICRGMQVLTQSLGGTIHQDMKAAKIAPLLKHSQDAERGVVTHSVVAEQGSIVAQLLGETFAVNSFHHQAVKTAGAHLWVTAHSKDGVVEAVESNEERDVIGVQWHPETLVEGQNREMLRLFEWLVERAKRYRKARCVHERVVTLDSHTDTPMFFASGVEVEQRDERVLVDAHKMWAGAMDAVFMVAYLPQGERSVQGHQRATQKAEDLLRKIQSLASEKIAIARTVEDIKRNKWEGRLSVVLGIENAYAFGREIENIRRFRDMGVVYATLCHNGDNDICDAASRSQREHGGLSVWGGKVVEEMNRVGMLVDLSHVGEESFYDVLEVSRVAPVCTHSCCRALCNHVRNLTDEQLRALAAKGGVAQMTFYHGFVKSEGETTIHDVVRHVLHAIEVCGIDHVGIGSDFDGDGGVRFLESEEDMLNLTMLLLDAGLTEEDLEKLWGGNFLRAVAAAQAYAKDRGEKE